MGYEVEISIDLKKNKNGLKTVDSLIEIADDNNCKRHFQFNESEGEVRRLKRLIHVIVFCFDNIEFENMTKFLEDTLKRYKKKNHHRVYLQYGNKPFDTCICILYVNNGERSSN